MPASGDSDLWQCRFSSVLAGTGKDQAWAEYWKQQAGVWGLWRRHKFLRMAKWVYCFGHMGQDVHTEGVGRESRKKAKKLQEPRGHRVTLGKARYVLQLLLPPPDASQALPQPCGEHL